jgi:hypothetical protein
MELNSITVRLCNKSVIPHKPVKTFTFYIIGRRKLLKEKKPLYRPGKAMRVPGG